VDQKLQEPERSGTNHPKSIKRKFLDKDAMPKPPGDKGPSKGEQLEQELAETQDQLHALTADSHELEGCQSVWLGRRAHQAKGVGKGYRNRA
jgi:hypothetical protein